MHFYFDRLYTFIIKTKTNYVLIFDSGNLLDNIANIKILNLSKTKKNKKQLNKAKHLNRIFQS